MWESTTVRGIKDRFAKDIAEHTVTCIREDGLYRHYRCRRPNTGCYGFDVVTWPGFLCMCGDMGEYLFSRNEDMIEFTRTSAMSYGCAAEKCLAHDGHIKEFCEESFYQSIKEAREEAERWSGDHLQERLDEIDAVVDAYECDNNPDDAIRAMYECDVWGGDPPSCKEFAHHFLWALHAIKWLCDKLEVLSGIRSVKNCMKSSRLISRSTKHFPASRLRN